VINRTETNQTNEVDLPEVVIYDTEQPLTTQMMGKANFKNDLKV